MNETYQPRLKTKTGAVLLAIFLGDFGCHWFYLGQSQRGWFYPGGYATCLVLMGVLGGLGDVGASIGAIFLLAYFVIALCRVWDVFYLCAMHPAEFDHLYNR